MWGKTSLPGFYRRIHRSVGWGILEAGVLPRSLGVGAFPWGPHTFTFWGIFTSRSIHESVRSTLHDVGPSLVGFFCYRVPFLTPISPPRSPISSLCALRTSRRFFGHRYHKTFWLRSPAWQLNLASGLPARLLSRGRLAGFTNICCAQATGNTSDARLGLLVRVVSCGTVTMEY